jgi:hypothetical protein
MSSRSRLPALAMYTALVAVAIGFGIGGMLVPVEPLEVLRYHDLFILALAVALGDQLLLPRKVGRSTALSVAVIASLALLLQSPALVLLLSVAAWAMQTLRSLRTDRRVRIGHLPASALLAWSLAGTTMVVASIDPLTWTIGKSAVSFLPVAAIWCYLLLVAPAIESLEVDLRAQRGRRLRYTDLVRAGLLPNTVVAATATLGALAYPELGAPAVLLMALPLLAAKLGFERDSDTQRNYDQTLRAMSRLPEQLGAVDPGHGVRAGEVAATAAVELGFGVDVAVDVERAAQLHEIGRIQADDGMSLPDGTALTREQIALSGADILRETGDLDRVARFILAHRGAVPVGDEEAWVAGAIIRLACDLDLRLTARGERRLEPSDQSWIRTQGVQQRIAEAVIHAAQVHYEPTVGEPA